MKKLKDYEIDRINIEGSIDKIIKELEEYKIKYSNRQNLRVCEESCYDGGYYHWLKGERLETDAEEALREKNEAEWAIRHEANQRAQFEALKAKFDP